MKTSALILSVVLALLVNAAFGEDVPTATDLVKKYYAAAGGKDAMMKVKSRIDKGKLTLPDMGMEATYTAYTQPPNSLNVSDFSGQGVVKNGNTDGVSWTLNPFQGNRKGKAPRPAEIFPFLNLDQLAGSAKVLGEEPVDGKTAYKVEMQPPNGNTLTVFFDKATGLVAASETKGANGNVTRSAFSDYKKVGDVQIPHKIEQSGGPLHLVTTAESVELNAAIPAGTFAMPDEIKALP